MVTMDVVRLHADFSVSVSVCVCISGVSIGGK